MRNKIGFLSAIILFLICANISQAQRNAGYHIGVVQPVLAINRGDVRYFYQNDFYAIGFPMGINFKLAGEVKFDFEFVPLLKPNVDLDKPYEVHLLYHPGFLFPIGNGLTFGFRLAFETGQGQFGFTPLLNKAFEIGNDAVFFIELVAPGRFGPNKNSGYTQVFGLHVGFGF
ncbi:MAG: hypothetical protein IPM34_04495 [Saprospiraceae bacterium]|nr:hypothetical protein [Saprospiraceae bacterium]